MVSIHLDPIHEKQLGELAKSQGQDAADLARRVLIDYLDLQSLPHESDGQWAEASVALTPEVIDNDPWDEDGPEG